MQDIFMIVFYSHACLLPNFLWNPLEILQDDDYHVFGLAVLDDHEWMVLRRIGNESGTGGNRLRPCREIMTDR